MIQFDTDIKVQSTSTSRKRQWPTSTSKKEQDGRRRPEEKGSGQWLTSAFFSVDGRQPFSSPPGNPDQIFNSQDKLLYPRVLRRGHFVVCLTVLDFSPLIMNTEGELSRSKDFKTKICHRILIIFNLNYLASDYSSLSSNSQKQKK